MTAILISIVCIAASLFIHYETLHQTSRATSRFHLRPRVRLWLLLCAAIVSHLIHILLYAIGFLLLEYHFDVGAIEGPDGGRYNDAFYFSIVSYTTLGIGDVYPIGQARLLSGVAALNGLVMVTWTASVTYLFMQRFWHIDEID